VKGSIRKPSSDSLLARADAVSNASKVSATTTDGVLTANATGK
jgi:hypothetical protein